LKLEPGHWYAWQMIPGYIGERCVPYCSPIYVKAVVPRSTGRGILHLDFENVLYARGVEEFSLDLRVLKRTPDYLLAEILYQEAGVDRSTVISSIEAEWIRRFCPELIASRPPAVTENISDYLEALFHRTSAR